MPIYEYQCESCAHKFEVKQSIKDDPISACERCGKPVRRLISSPGIMFKGSGWYVTDYSDKMKPPAEKSSGPAAGEKKEAAPSAPPAATAPPASTAPAPASSGSGTAAPSASSSSSASGGTSGST